MADNRPFGVSEMHELAVSGRKVGWAPGEFGTLANNHRLLGDMHDVLGGFAEIRHIPHVIDGDAVLPKADRAAHDNGHLPLHLHEHIKLGELQCERHGVDLWLNGRPVVLRRRDTPDTPAELRRWIDQVRGDDLVLNGAVAQFLKENPQFWSPAWDDVTLFFPGTRFRTNKDKRLADDRRWEFAPAVMSTWEGLTYGIIQISGKGGSLPFRMHEIALPVLEAVAPPVEG